MEIETIYIPDGEFVIFIRSIPWSRKELKSVDGHFRWIVEGDDKVKRYVRPEIGKEKL